MQTHPSWKHAFFLAAALSAAAAPAAQIGVPTVNDYTVTGSWGGGYSGAAGCTSIDEGAGGKIVNLKVSAAPSTPVVFLLSALPCAPWNFGTTCTPAAFQALQINLIPGTYLPLAHVSNSTYPLLLPTGSGFAFSTQALILDLTCTGSFGIRFSQAYEVDY